MRAALKEKEAGHQAKRGCSNVDFEGRAEAVGGARNPTGGTNLSCDSACLEHERV